MERHWQPTLNNQEPLETRYLSKKQLYLKLSDEYYLPSLRSQGMTRRYLLKVQNNQVFRAHAVSVKRCLAELKNSQLTKFKEVNVAVSYQRIDNLLKEMKLPCLVFEPHETPEAAWLYAIARYLDPNNITGILSSDLKEQDNMNCDSSKLDSAKKAAKKYLFKDYAIESDEKLRSSLEDITLIGSKIRSRNARISKLQSITERYKREVLQEKKKLELTITKTTTDILTKVGGEHAKLEEWIQDNTKLAKAKEVSQL